VLPEKYLKMKLEIDAGNVYALLKTNQPDAARRLVKESKAQDRTEGRVTHYWRIMPDGMDVARNWADLMQNKFASSMTFFEIVKAEFTMIHGRVVGEVRHLKDF